MFDSWECVIEFLLWAVDRSKQNHMQKYQNNYQNNDSNLMKALGVLFKQD